ncbi:hypothetical protein RA989_20985, partial [Mycobacteroides abscessus subsp. massiliense]
MRFDADQKSEWTATVDALWFDAKSDLAILTISVPDTAPKAEPARLGRLADRDAVVEAQVVGFPLFKMRNYDGTAVDWDEEKSRYRDTHQAVGRIAVLSNRQARRPVAAEGLQPLVDLA